MDYSVNKFSNYCLRLLMKKGHIDFSKTSLYYYLIKRLEEIADKYKDLCTSHLKHNEKINNELIALFNKTNVYLKELYKSCYSYNEKELENMFKETKETAEQIANQKGVAAFYLSTIVEDIRNLFSTIIEINI